MRLLWALLFIDWMTQTSIACGHEHEQTAKYTPVFLSLSSVFLLSSDRVSFNLSQLVLFWTL